MLSDKVKEKLFAKKEIQQIDLMTVSLPLKICFIFFSFCIEYSVTMIWLAKFKKVNNSFNKSIFVMVLWNCLLYGVHCGRL